MNARFLQHSGLLALASLCCHAAEVDVTVTSSPQAVVVNNDGDEAKPTIYLMGQTDASAQPPRHTLGPTLNGVRLCERMLSQAVLILRSDGTGTYGYRAGFELFPEPITLWPEHEMFFGKWKCDPLQPARVTRSTGNFLTLASANRPVSTMYELSFPDPVRIRSVKVEANCDQRTAGYDAITRVWADPQRKQRLGETSRKAGSDGAHYPHVVTGLDTSRAFVELTSNGKMNWSGAYRVTLSAELDTKAIKLPPLVRGRNEFTYSDDEASSHRARLIFRWGKPERRRTQAPIPDAILNYRSPLADASPKEGRIVKLSEFFPLGFYGGVDKCPSNVVAWLMDRMREIHCNAWHINNLNMARLGELLPMAEARDMRLLAQGGGWASLYYCAGLGTPAQRKQVYASTLVPNAKKIVPPWRDRWGLLAWSLVEEINRDHVKEITPYYALMRELDPTHESLVLHNSHVACVEDMALNRNPVAFHDTYPFFIEPRSGPCSTSRSLAYFRQRLAQFAATAKERGVPMWVMAQSYGEPVGFDPDPPYFGHRGGVTPPTPAHLRVQAWLSLAYGAKGLWWYAYRVGLPVGISPISPDWKLTPLWNEIGRIHARISRLSGLLLKLEPAPDAKTAEVIGKNLYSAWRKRGGDASEARYLIVVNESLTEPRAVTVKPINIAHKVRDISSSQLEERSSLTLQPGDGAVFVVMP
ncbi:MAG: hypothetical protein HZC54_13845 [Verrucomicrobia bacterium]|nr:hypothetical protein [Verrucomicrobiota bacterium]